MAGVRTTPSLIKKEVVRCGLREVAVGVTQQRLIGRSVARSEFDHQLDADLNGVFQGGFDVIRLQRDVVQAGAVVLEEL